VQPVRDAGQAFAESLLSGEWMKLQTDAPEESFS